MNTTLTKFDNNAKLPEYRTSHIAKSFDVGKVSVEMPSMPNTAALRAGV
jgi:hypothetical protein